MKVLLVFGTDSFYNQSMIALKILDIKNFTAGFLTGTWLDSYELAEASITTFCTMSIDGTRQKDFFGDGGEEAETSDGDAVRAGRTSLPLTPWRDIKPICFAFIRGKKLPLGFKFVFFFPHEQLPSFLDHYNVDMEPGSVRGLCMNLRYDSGGLILTTGTSVSQFTMDRTLDHTWDTYVRAWLRYHRVAAEEM